MPGTDPVSEMIRSIALINFILSAAAVIFLNTLGSSFYSHSHRYGFDLRISLLQIAYKNLENSLCLLLMAFSVFFFFITGKGGITTYG